MVMVPLALDAGTVKDAVLVEVEGVPLTPFVPLFPLGPIGPGVFTTTVVPPELVQHPDEGIRLDGILVCLSVLGIVIVSG